MAIAFSSKKHFICPATNPMLLLLLAVVSTSAFINLDLPNSKSYTLSTSSRPTTTRHFVSKTPSPNNTDEQRQPPPPNDINTLLKTRFPTSVDDQIRQAATALKDATTTANITRHSIKLLLPLIGATELDDWPGGSRQQMEAAAPLVRNILKLSTTDDDRIEDVDESVVDDADGVRALFARASIDPSNDSCALLLPSGDNVEVVRALDRQVGEKRNLVLVNAQWRNVNDFGFFGRKTQVAYAESFHPTFSCGSLMVEGDQVRVLRAFPGPWRVYLMTTAKEDDGGGIDWVLIGTKDFVSEKNDGWDANAKGRVFDYGRPTYREIEEMIVNREGYVPKSLAERAMAAVSFIKDTI